MIYPVLRKPIKGLISLSLTASFLISCNESATEQVVPNVGISSQGLTVELGRLTTIEELRSESSSLFLKDAPAEETYRRMQAMFSDKSHLGLRLPFFRLASLEEPASRLDARRAALTMPADTILLSNRRDEVARSERWELRIGRVSGTERYFDRTRFHKEFGTSMVFPDGTYLTWAKQHIENLVQAPEVGLYPYKIRHYMNASTDDGTTVVESTYQIAVAFNSSVAGLPVIGPGGKVAVHLSTSGEVLSHESTLRAGSQIATLTGSDLVSPADALKDAQNRLVARGISLQEFGLERSEFGYLRRGRNSAQDYLGPHYAFFFAPNTGVVGKRIVETVPAVSRQDILELINQDEALENERKASQMGEQTIDDAR